MVSRKKLNDSTHFEVVYQSARRCCMCFCLDKDFTQKSGQVAHIDQDRTNNTVSNLAWLCLPHHNDYDSQTSQSRGYTEGELRKYRGLLHAEVQRWRDEQPHPDSDVVGHHRRQLLNENSAVLFFAAFAAREPLVRKRLLEEVVDLDIRAGLAEAWLFLDTREVPDRTDLSRMELMAQYIASTEEGKEDLNVLLGLAGEATWQMNEQQRNYALFALKSDTIRSALMLLNKIRLDRTTEKRSDV